MSKTLQLKDYCRAAQRLSCELAAIRAVAIVESGRLGGFLPNGNVTILFERHHFSRLTRRAFDESHPQISSRNAGGYYGGEKEYQRFNIAYRLNPAAAMMSASWGRFQIMGFNYGVVGFTTIHKFVDAMKHSEGAQLLAFCEFVETNNLDDELRRKDWAGFARGYNGKNYKINKYDEKMAQYYAKFRQEKVDCAALLNAAPVVATTGSAQPVIAENRIIVKGANPFQNISDAEIDNLSSPILPNTSSNLPNGAGAPGAFDTPATIPPQTEGGQVAENITNVHQGSTVPPDFKPEDKPITAPAADHSTSTAAKITIAGIAVPSFIVAIVQTVKDLVSQGYVNAQQLGDLVLGFLMQNTHYIFYAVLLTIVGLILKKAWKQLSFMLAMWLTARSDTNNPVIKPAPEVPTSDAPRGLFGRIRYVTTGK